MLQKASNRKCWLYSYLVSVGFLATVALAPCLAMVSNNLLRNSSFEQGVNENGLAGACWLCFSGAKSAVAKMEKKLPEREFWVDFCPQNACKYLQIEKLYVFT